MRYYEIGIVNSILWRFFTKRRMVTRSCYIQLKFDLTLNFHLLFFSKTTNIVLNKIMKYFIKNKTKFEHVEKI